jgi:hypothetical protein
LDVLFLKLGFLLLDLFKVLQALFQFLDTFWVVHGLLARSVAAGEQE